MNNSTLEHMIKDVIKYLDTLDYSTITHETSYHIQIGKVVFEHRGNDDYEFRIDNNTGIHDYMRLRDDSDVSFFLRRKLKAKYKKYVNQINKKKDEQSIAVIDRAKTDHIVPKGYLKMKLCLGHKIEFDEQHIYNDHYREGALHFVDEKTFALFKLEFDKYVAWWKTNAEAMFDNADYYYSDIFHGCNMDKFIERLDDAKEQYRNNLIKEKQKKIFKV